ncbi:restriction endonuclease subunit S [Microbulbifer sp. OS29]|uniref:Restriction endonuclease subunit S n=1 Tax=Microbulbifer okhotskensis TaxID=2926617 RepID=A0A9X2EJ11_9GAMM|nr:restriction endonuclease subunit S [Microbulbifer okhotskensis]MCO1333154.1 restriction endonuclease subunit S [Microbulbifer okhotskensis]
MSVDTLRETFHINRISHQDLQDFLTAQTYRPEITEAKRKIRSLPWANLQGVCSKPIRQGKSPKYLENTGLVCVKPKNTNDMLVSLEDTDFIDPLTVDQINNQKLKYGDIVITRSGSGTIGRASIYSGQHDVYTNDHLFIVQCKTADSHYVCSFLNSYWGARLLEAGISGSTGQLNLSNEHIKNIPLYKPNELAQKYIGDKVRQAEELRAWAKGLENQFTQTLSQAYPEAFIDKRTGRKYSKAPVDDISYTLNPGAFDEERLRIRIYLKSKGAQKLRTIASIQGPTTSDYSAETVYVGLDAISSGSCALSVSTVGDSDVKGTSRLLTEGAVVAKLRPYLNKVAYIPAKYSGAVGSTELLCVQPSSDVSSWYLYGALKSEITLKQLKPLASGSTHPRIDQYDLYDVVLPIHSEYETLGEMLQKAQSAYFYSKDLTTAAKLLVEALIEGQLTEPQLIDAQQALEAGDNSLDQAILAGLTPQGFNADPAANTKTESKAQSQALFSDLDELTRLLEQAQEAAND